MTVFCKVETWLQEMGNKNSYDKCHIQLKFVDRKKHENSRKQKSITF